MTYSELLNKEFKRTGSDVRIEPLPTEQGPSAKSIKQLDREISSQISENAAMRLRSMEKRD